MSGKQYERVRQPRRVDVRVVRMENHANSKTDGEYGFGFAQA